MKEGVKKSIQNSTSSKHSSNIVTTLVVKVVYKKTGLRLLAREKG